MDPPDILGVDPSTARPTQLPGRAKSEQLFLFSLPAGCAKPPSLCPAARVMGCNPLLYTSLLLLASCKSGSSWGIGACCHLAMCYCQQRGWPAALPGWTLPHCPSSRSLAPSQSPAAGLPGAGDLSGNTARRELRGCACAATPSKPAIFPWETFPLVTGDAMKHAPC